MASLFADRVRDTATSVTGSTVTLSGSAPTGFQSFNSGIGNGNPCVYCIADTAGNWEVNAGVYTNSTTSLARGTPRASSNSGAQVSSFSGTISVFVDAPAAMLLPSQGTIFGLALSNDANNQKIDCGAGQASDTTGVVLMSTAGATPAVDFTGTGAGKLDTGTIAASTWYHIFLIAKPDGTTNFLGSTSASAPTLPTGYVYFRRIGSVLTDGSSHFLSFTQVNDTFYWATQVRDVNVTNLATTSTLYTLSTPLNVKVQPIIRAYSFTAAQAVIITSPDETDVAPSASPWGAAPGNDFEFQTSAPSVGVPLNLMTNTSSQIRARASNTSTSLYVITRGWRDYRGELSNP